MVIFRMALSVLLVAVSVPSAAATVAPSSFVISGAGLGHGVGMSQVGAFVQAQNGKTAAEIIAHYYPNTELTVLDDSASIFVNVAANQSTMTIIAKPIRVNAATSLTVSNLATPTPIAEPITISAQGNDVLVSGVTGVLATAPTIELSWSGVTGFTSTDPKSEIEITRTDGSKTTYRFGPLILSAKNNRIQAVLKLRVKDEYLNLVAEMASTWPEAALQAQAIASRSIAMTAVNAGIKSSCGCHVNYVGDQNMRGSERYKLPGYSNWRKAVKTTAGQVVSINQQPIPAWFFARSNGKTENSEDVWGSPRPWAKSVEDQFSLDPLAGPQFRWSVPVSAAQLATLFKLPDVVKVRVATRNAGGSVRTFRATSSTGESATLSGRNLRAAIPTRSVWIQNIKPVGS